MTPQAHSLPCNPRQHASAGGWLARLGRAVAAAYRETYVSHHELDRRLLADVGARSQAASPDEVRDAWRHWFGGDPTRFL